MEKTKTFEELIDENLALNSNSFRYKRVLQLLQQVREATKAECIEIADNGYYWASTIKKIEDLPKDRIKLK